VKSQSGLLSIDLIGKNFESFEIIFNNFWTYTIIMSLELPFEDIDQEILDLIYYLRTSIELEESKDKECVVCGEIQNQWYCYQLPCLHYGHTRCLRKWISTKYLFKKKVSQKL
jgi:hypothetical protein